jgi:hypothetical protein
MLPEHREHVGESHYSDERAAGLINDPDVPDTVGEGLGHDGHERAP